MQAVRTVVYINILKDYTTCFGVYISKVFCASWSQMYKEITVSKIWDVCWCFYDINRFQTPTLEWNLNIYARLLQMFEDRLNIFSFSLYWLDIKTYVVLLTNGIPLRKRLASNTFGNWVSTTTFVGIVKLLRRDEQ